MVNLNDFQLKTNGKAGSIKVYQTTCDTCGVSRGYQRLREQGRPCRNCSKRKTTSINVNFKDFIKGPFEGTKYRTSCLKCSSDRGYKFLHQSNKVCKSCGIRERHDKSLSKEYIDTSDFIMSKDPKCKRRLFKTSCYTCGIDRGYQRRSVNKNCRKCASYLTHKGKEVSDTTKAKMKKSNYLNNGGTHPFLGKSHSPSTKEQLSLKQIKYCKQFGGQFKGHTHSVETKATLSIKNSGKEPRWKGRVFQYDGPKGTFKMRSSYELFYAKWMDSQDIEWKYEPRYTLSNGMTFSPDFQLSSGDIIEIKGFWTEKGLYKWTLFCSDYPTTNKKVLMRDDLVCLGMEI